MRRLFSTFAYGAPGAGLLLLRVAASCALVYHCVAVLSAGLAPVAALDILCAAMGVLLAVGLWTPVVAALAAIGAALLAIFNPSDVGFYLLLAALCAALALIGPGAWSLDARLFGWRRVEIRNGYALGKRRKPRPE